MWRRRCLRPSLRFHVRRPGAAFGSSLASQAENSPRKGTHEVEEFPPDDPSPAEIALATLQMNTVIGYARPDDPINVEHFLTEHRWRGDEAAAWRGVIGQSWGALTAGLSHQRRILAARVAISDCLGERASGGTVPELAVLREMTETETGPSTAATANAARSTRESVSANEAMRIRLMLVLNGLDMTALFEAGHDCVAAVGRALEADTESALKLPKAVLGASVFRVRAVDVQHGPIAAFEVWLPKSRNAASLFRKTLAQKVEQGNFALRTTRDVVLNLLHCDPTPLFVSEGWCSLDSRRPPEVTEPLPLCPLRIPFDGGPKTRARRSETAPSDKNAQPATPTTFLEAVWRDRKSVV